MATKSSSEPPKCRRCNQPILFVLTDKGRYVPVQPEKQKLDDGGDGTMVFVPHRDFCIGDADRGDSQGSFA